MHGGLFFTSWEKDERERLGRIKGQPRSGRRSAKRIKPNPPAPRLRSPGGGNKKSPRQLRRQGVAKKNPPPAGGKGSGWPRKKNPDSRWQGRRRVKVSMRACEAKKHTHSERNVGLSQARRRPRPAHHETRAEKHPHTPKKGVRVISSPKEASASQKLGLKIGLGL